MSDVVVVGSYVQDLAFNTEVFPAPGETRIGTFQTGAGGKGFNQAVACNRQEVPTLFIGAVGDDIFGRGVRDFISGESFLQAQLQVSENPTGAASIVVNGQAENLIVVALGANDDLSVDHLKAFADEIRGAKILITQVESNISTTVKALQMARDYGVTRILNPAPINYDITTDLVKLTDVLVPNETEFAFLAKLVSKQELPDNYWLASDREIHDYCCQAGVATVVLTLGDKGCFVSHNPDIDRQNPRVQNNEFFYRVPAIQVKPQDTTGAGDGFNGGLAAGMIRYPDDFKRAIHYANAVAGLSTTKAGTAPSMPNRVDVDAWMRSN